MVQSQSFQVQCESEDKDLSELEESESQEKMQNVTIFAPNMDFGKKEPMAVGKPPAIIQQESEDEEMHQAEESVLKPDSEEAQVNQIINAFNFATVFQAKAYKTKNVGLLKRSYRKHLKEAAKIKRILKKLGQRVQADSDSDDSSDKLDFEMVSKRALNSYMEVQNK